MKQETLQPAIPCSKDDFLTANRCRPADYGEKLPDKLFEILTYTADF